jgi:hypothetical protein
LALLRFAQLHELVETEGVSQSVDRVELASDEDAFEDIVVREAARAQGIDVIIRDLVGVLSQLHAQTEQRPVFLLDRQRVDIRRFGRRGGFLAASYGPQEK